jgi:3-oxoacyl-(acyl-carrier-protein) synthase
MTQALQRAGLQPQDISYVNAHGTGTPNNDVSESFALKRVFGDEMPQVSSTKGLTGHTTSASGSVEAVICLLAMRHDLIPVNYGWAHQIEGGITPATDPTPLRPLDHVMSNAFGFGGNDSSIILSRHHA